MALSWYQVWYGGDRFAPCNLLGGVLGALHTSAGYSLQFDPSALTDRNQSLVSVILNAPSPARPGMPSGLRCSWGADDCVVRQSPSSDYRTLFESELMARCSLRYLPLTNTLRVDDCGENIVLESLVIRARPYSAHVNFGRDAGPPPDAPSCL